MSLSFRDAFLVRINGFAMDQLIRTIHSKSRFSRSVRAIFVFSFALLCSSTHAASIVAFNDFVDGLGTGSNVTTYGPGQTGPLKNIANGSALPISVAVTASAQVAGAVQGRPDYGSPASIVFDGIVDFAGFPDPAIEITGAAFVTYTFS